jgi:hypothetical protein
MKLTTEKIGDQRIDIEVDGNGKFSATFDETDYTAKTIEELRELLRSAIKKAKATKPIEVTVLGLVPRKKSIYSGNGEPFEDGPGYVQAKLRGEHGTRRHVYLLISDDDRFENEKFQIGGYGSNDAEIVARLSLVEVLRYTELLELKRAATTAVEDFVGAHKFDITEALAAARKVEAVK